MIQPRIRHDWHLSNELTKQIIRGGGTEIQNLKYAQNIENEPIIIVLVIEYWSLWLVCDLLARRLSGGVLVI